MVRFHWVVSSLALSLCTVCPQIRGEEPSFQAVLYLENLMIPMRDGARLAADVYRQARDGVLVEVKQPLLLHRTPYDKKDAGLVDEAKYFASHGYVVVVQDVRGRYRSEGVFSKYIGEGRDGYDTIEQVALLPYTDGRVGMWGTSYAAHVQANAAKLRPPHLRTMVLNMGGMSNGWDHKIRNHGAFELQQLTWTFRQIAAETDDPVVRDMLRTEQARDWLTAFPFRKGLSPLAAAPNYEDDILTMLTHGDYDDYWKHPDINWVEHFDETADIPMILISGWYDSYCGGTIQNFLGLSRLQKSPVHLLMGPWTHGGNTRSFAGEVEFGPEAALSDFDRDFHLLWFDRFLKDGSRSAPDVPRVRIFVMGTGDDHRNESGRLHHGGTWRTANEWPLPGTQLTPYYFHADGSLRDEPPPAGIPPTTYTHDPADPVPTIGGAFSSTSPVFEPGAYNQREREGFFGSRPPHLPLKARADVVVFQTEPLTEDIEVVGPIVVRLYVSSTAIDTDFTAKLIDVVPPSRDYPSGFDMNLTDGILRARYRESPARAVSMKPGEVVEVAIEPFPTANVFKEGHRIRVDLSSSNFPRFDVNPGTGEPAGTGRRRIPADNSIYHDAEHPSHIVLPIVPR